MNTATDFFTTARTYRIVSSHATITEAVNASGIDLSYNEPLARQNLARAERDGRHGRAWVVTDEQGQVTVLYRYHADIQLINEYTPFHSMMHDGNFSRVFVRDDVIEFSAAIVNRKARPQIAKLGWTVGLL